MSAPANRWMLPLLGLTLLAGGCSSVGDFCHSDDDCGSGLRCSAISGARGVCTYPVESVDLAHKDQTIPDLVLPDASGDLPSGDSAPDLAPDLAKPDLAKPDLATPDTAKPDTQSPDATLPDAPAVDLTSPDAGQDT